MKARGCAATAVQCTKRLPGHEARSKPSPPQHLQARRHIGTSREARTAAMSSNLPAVSFGKTVGVVSARVRSFALACSADVEATVPDMKGSPNGWSQVTEKLVQLSTIPFIFLLAPQLIKNTSNMMSGHPEALAILSWVGFLTALLANTLLLSYFVNKKEGGAVLIQAIGGTSNFVMLTQIFYAGYMPAPVYSAAVAVAAGGAIINGSRLLGLLKDGSPAGAAWTTWLDALSLIGVAMLPQALCYTFLGTTSLLPGSVAGAAGVVFLALLRAGKLPEGYEAAWAGASGWTATLLFMFQPLAQLAQNFAVPSSLAGLSAGSVVLATVANGLMVPRALYTADPVWFSGSAWGSLCSWAQLLSMYVALDAAGTRFISPSVFWPVTAVVFAYFGTVLVCDSGSKGLPSPISSLAGLVRGSGKEGKP